VKVVVFLRGSVTAPGRRWASGVRVVRCPNGSVTFKRTPVVVSYSKLVLASVASVVVRTWPEAL
jgi:hypothetical protein